MRGKTKLISLVAILAILLSVSVFFASGVVDVSRFALFAQTPQGEPPAEPDSPGAGNLALKPKDSLLVNTGYHAANPIWATTKDYVLDSGFAKGNKFNVTVEITNVVDLFTWQVNMTWNPAVLNLSNIYRTDFLGATKDTSSEALNMVINDTRYVSGFSAIAETVLGDVAGVTNAGTGVLVKVEFKILAYGGTDITLLPSTKLLDHLGAEIPQDSKTNGYFRNTIKGDAKVDLPTSVVDIADVVKVKTCWYPGPPMGAGYDKVVDTKFDGAIDIADIVLLKTNWGRSVTP